MLLNQQSALGSRQHLLLQLINVEFVSTILCNSLMNHGYVEPVLCSFPSYKVLDFGMQIML